MVRVCTQQKAFCLPSSCDGVHDVDVCVTEVRGVYDLLSHGLVGRLFRVSDRSHHVLSWRLCW